MNTNEKICNVKNMRFPLLGRDNEFAHVGLGGYDTLIIMQEKDLATFMQLPLNRNLHATLFDPLYERLYASYRVHAWLGGSRISLAALRKEVNKELANSQTIQGFEVFSVQLAQILWISHLDWKYLWKIQQQ